MNLVRGFSLAVEQSFPELFETKERMESVEFKERMESVEFIFQGLYYQLICLLLFVLSVDLLVVMFPDDYLLSFILSLNIICTFVSTFIWKLLSTGNCPVLSHTNTYS